MKSLMFKTFLFVSVLHLLGCLDQPKCKKNLKQLEINCIEFGDYNSYLELIEEYTTSSYDIKETSINVARKYNWGMAYYMIYEITLSNQSDLSNIDSTILNYAIENLNKSVELKCPQGLLSKSFFLRKGLIFKRDTLQSKIMYEEAKFLLNKIVQNENTVCTP